jgi:hypothetical protein
MYEDDELNGFETSGPFAVVGDVMGHGYFMEDEVSGRVVRARRAPPRRAVATRAGGMFPVRAPFWRGGQLAPGVQAPQEGLISLPLTPVQNGGVFNAANSNITFTGQTQKPFRGERILATVVRTGVSATGRILTQLFVGTDLQQASIEGLDLEVIGNPQAFGVRLAMSPAQPGVFFNFPCRVTVPLAGPDTIAVSIQVLGRGVH